MARKATPKKAPVKKPVVKKAATPKAKKPTTRKAKSDPEDLLDIPVFLRRWIGKVEVTGYERDDKGVLLKVGNDGNKYVADTDKKVTTPRKKASKKA